MRIVKGAGQSHIQARRARGESYASQNRRAVGRIREAAPKPPPTKKRSGR